MSLQEEVPPVIVGSPDIFSSPEIVPRSPMPGKVNKNAEDDWYWMKLYSFFQVKGKSKIRSKKRTVVSHVVREGEPMSDDRFIIF